MRLYCCTLTRCSGIVIRVFVIVCSAIKLEAENPEKEAKEKQKQLYEGTVNATMVVL